MDAGNVLGQHVQRSGFSFCFGLDQKWWCIPVIIVLKRRKLGGLKILGHSWLHKEFAASLEYPRSYLRKLIFENLMIGSNFLSEKSRYGGRP